MHLTFTKVDVLEVNKENYLTADNRNSDKYTDFNAAMSDINNAMPTRGTGADSSTPQELLFIVSDGNDDNSATTCSGTVESNGRCHQAFDTTWCATVKSRGIRIAVLPTVYLPIPGNDDYNKWIAPYQSQVAPNLQACASPGLFFSVTTDDDITAAMRTLFEQAIGSARLTR